MSFLWPRFLYGIGLVPLTVLIYLWGIHRRHRYTVRMSSLTLVREAASNQSQWRRHLPFTFFLFALVSLIVAICRPLITINVPSKQGTIILALDVSRSMCSTDIQPTRLQALEMILLRFITLQSSSTKIGVIAFSDFAELIQPPTNDKAAVDRAIQNLMTGSQRAVGDGIYESLDVIAKEEGSNGSRNLASTPNRPKVYAPAVIILVTNGANNTGPSPLDAARLSAERGIRIYTVGISSPSGLVNTSCQSSDPSEFDQGSGSGITGSNELDVNTLKQIAALTDARYFSASDTSGLKNIFRNAQLQTVSVREEVEVTFAFVTSGVLSAMISFLLSLFWSPLL